MKLQKLLIILPLVAAFAAPALAENSAENDKKPRTTVSFSAEIQRTVEKDVMQAEIYSRQTGKGLAALRKSVSAALNPWLAQVKSHADIEIVADGVRHFADYDHKGKVSGWVAEGRVHLSSQNFDAMAQVLEQLGDKLAIGEIRFSLSPAKIAALEEEMTQAVIRQFQHKASVIQQSLHAKSYRLSEVQLHTPSHDTPHAYLAKSAYATMESATQDALPLEAGKATLSATATCTAVFE